jgi:uncharacterized membrane protein SpoIIM required for sporulation
MKEVQFISHREADWEAWERWLRQPKPEAAEMATLPRRFRQLCLDLSLAQERGYSSRLQDRLHALVLAAHQRIYGARKQDGNAVLHFILHGFPALVRREGRLVAAAAVLLALPLAIMLIALQFHPEGVYLVMSAEAASRLEDMYAPTAAHLGRPPDVSNQWMMWALYIGNNVRIDFQCFAGGIAYGVGAILFLLYNGLFIGAVAGHLTQIGYIDTFWGFVAGHSAFELTGALLSGAAGLKLGLALVAPGRRSRASALKQHARVAVNLLYGAATLTFFAAFIEAFWSPLRLPLPLKYGVGVGLWLLTWGYLFYAGRERDAA